MKTASREWTKTCDWSDKQRETKSSRENTRLLILTCSKPYPHLPRAALGSFTVTSGKTKIMSIHHSVGSALSMNILNRVQVQMSSRIGGISICQGMHRRSEFKIKELLVRRNENHGDGLLEGFICGAKQGVVYS